MNRIRRNSSLKKSDSPQPELTPEEWGRVHKTLMDRQRRLGDPGFRFIGFGVRRRGGRIEAGATIVVKYYFVRKKSQRLPSGWRVPPEVRVRLKRGRRFISLQLPTDVEVAGRILASALNLHAEQSCTGGVLVRWRVSAQQLFLGVLTVGHALRTRTGGGIVQVQVRNRSRSAFGQLYAVARAHTCDAAVIKIDYADLCTLLADSTGYLKRNTVIAVPLSEAIVAAKGTTGRSFNTHENVAFKLISYVPQFRPGPSDTLPPLSHLLHVETTADRGFQPGTSGSAWTLGGNPVAIQVGGNASNQYREGYGQVLEYIMDWTRTDVHRSCKIAHVF